MPPTADFLGRIAHSIDWLNEWVGRIVAWLTLGMVAVTFLIVVLAYFFNTGWIWMQESVTYMHAIVFMLAAGYTLKHDAHVRVDIFYRAMAPRRKAWVNLLGALLLLLPVCGFIFWASWDYVIDAWALGETSAEPGGLPWVYLLKSVILVMAVLFALQGIAQVLHSLRVLLGREPAEPTHPQETEL